MTQTTTKASAFTSIRFILKSLLYLIIGLIIGIEFTLILFNESQRCNPLLVQTSELLLTQTNKDTNSMLSLISANQTAWMDEENISSHQQTSSVVQHLFNSTRVMCWIMTHPDNHQARAVHIRNTWGRRCNIVLFMSTQADETLPSIQLPVENGPDHLWNKTKLALKYIYDHHLNDADWFLKADDDTYVVMENLRMLLYKYPADAPVYFGCKLKRQYEEEYMVGGAGYVLSKSALVKFINEAYDNGDICSDSEIDENFALGNCLRNIGVVAGDSRDEQLKERFIPVSPTHVIPEFKMEWYAREIYHSENENVTCCSDHAISFHYTTWREFYTLDYLIYSLRPFGVFADIEWKLPEKLNISDLYSVEREYFENSTQPIET
ncbi:glycoprotein-N-acetylgalactosamine 3-beta-galactosyltransferase 1-like [Musca autumnalis]|uniref:glycoprotein-N-acetylgalactosamine 3-beta-galactosyltransferase 1-like n=1 Tax=Musca autumnalis TaxID=221902 RepID=UPI003CFA1BBE